MFEVPNSCVNKRKYLQKHAVTMDNYENGRKPRFLPYCQDLLSLIYRSLVKTLTVFFIKCVSRTIKYIY